MVEGMMASPQIEQLWRDMRRRLRRPAGAPPRARAGQRRRPAPRARGRGPGAGLDGRVVRVHPPGDRRPDLARAPRTTSTTPWRPWPTSGSTRCTARPTHRLTVVGPRASRVDRRAGRDAQLKVVKTKMAQEQQQRRRAPRARSRTPPPARRCRARPRRRSSQVGEVRTSSSSANGLTTAIAGSGCSGSRATWRRGSAHRGNLSAAGDAEAGRATVRPARVHRRGSCPDSVAGCGRTSCIS